MNMTDKSITSEIIQGYSETDLRDIFNQLPDCGEKTNEVIKSAIRLGYLEGIHRGLHIIMQSVDGEKDLSL